MVNIQHLHKFLNRFTTIDPNRGMPVGDLLEFYNDFCKRQRSNFSLSANIFRGVLEMYMVCQTRQFNITMINGRTSIIKGLKVNSGDAAAFMDLIKYSLLEEDNPTSVRDANNHYKNLSQIWDQADQSDKAVAQSGDNPSNTPSSPGKDTQGQKTPSA